MGGRGNLVFIGFPDLRVATPSRAVRPWTRQ